VDTEAQWRADQQALREELEALESRLAEAQQEREKLRQAMDNEMLSLYDSLRGRFGSIAVATLRDGVCGYCAVAPPSTKLRLIRSGREIVECSNCGRILLAL
jgi:predicted  nucleic acid-binding Zn-ribbon protein